jgi:hypothetical protein
MLAPGSTPVHPVEASVPARASQNPDLSAFPVIVPALLRAWRIRAGLRAETVAELLGGSFAAVTAWERGQNGVPGHVLVRLAHIYGCRVEDFCTPRAAS